MDCPPHFSIIYYEDKRYITRPYDSHISLSRPVLYPFFYDMVYEENRLNGDDTFYSGNIYQIENEYHILKGRIGILFCIGNTRRFSGLPQRRHAFVLFVQDETTIITAIQSVHHTPICQRNEYIEFKGDKGKEWTIKFDTLALCDRFVIKYNTNLGVVTVCQATASGVDVNVVQMIDEELEQQSSEMNGTNAPIVNTFDVYKVNLVVLDNILQHMQELEPKQATEDRYE